MIQALLGAPIVRMAFSTTPRGVRPARITRTSVSACRQFDGYWTIPASDRSQRLTEEPKEVIPPRGGSRSRPIALLRVHPADLETGEFPYTGGPWGTSSPHRSATSACPNYRQGHMQDWPPRPISLPPLSRW